MSNHSLKAISPLGEAEPRIDEIGAIRIVEVLDNALASIAQRAGQEKQFASAVKKGLKLVLPKPGMSATKGNITAFWSGPEQWFVEAPEASHEDIATILKASFKESASITEQSGGWCCFDVEGSTCVSLLERICAVDMALMEQDAATRCVIEHIGCFILCRVPSKHVSVYGPRSSASSLHHALVTAANSVA